jgi:hypothetical protein
VNTGFNTSVDNKGRTLNMSGAALITPPGILEHSALFKPRTSRLKPTDPPSYYAKVLFSYDSTKTAAWKLLEKTLVEFGTSFFGSQYAAMAKAGMIRSPIRTDVVGKGWPAEIGCFLNVKSGEEYPPSIVAIGGKGLVRVDDPTLLYPGAIVRVSLRIYGYGGKGSPYQAGISFGPNNIQKLDDGPRLAVGRPDGSEFGGEVGDDLDDLLK